MRRVQWPRSKRSRMGVTRLMISTVWLSITGSGSVIPSGCYGRCRLPPPGHKDIIIDERPKPCKKGAPETRNEVLDMLDAIIYQQPASPGRHRRPSSCTNIYRGASRSAPSTVGSGNQSAGSTSGAWCSFFAATNDSPFSVNAQAVRLVASNLSRKLRARASQSPDSMISSLSRK